MDNTIKKTADNIDLNKELDSNITVEDKEGTVKCSTNTLVLFAWIGESAWILPPKP